MRATAAERQRRAASMLLAAVALGPGPASACAGPPGARSIDIGRQDLEQALPRLGEQADLQILADTRILAGLRAPAIAGCMRPAEALLRLLTGSGLHANFAGGSVTLERGVPASGGVKLEPIVLHVGVSIAGERPNGEWLYVAGVLAAVQKRLAGFTLPGGAETRVMVRVWIAADGTITRLEAGEPTATPNLGELLSGRLMGLAVGPPPRHLVEPLRLSLRFVHGIAAQ